MVVSKLTVQMGPDGTNEDVMAKVKPLYSQMIVMFFLLLLITGRYRFFILKPLKKLI